MQRLTAESIASDAEQGLKLSPVVGVGYCQEMKTCGTILCPVDPESGLEMF